MSTASEDAEDGKRAAPTDLDLTARVAVAEGVLFREVGGEAVLVQLQSGLYFGLDEVGTRMWLALVDRGVLDEAFAMLLDEYEVEPDRLRSDFLDLVGQMVQSKLLEVREG
jgi:hypothetical protein